MLVKHVSLKPNFRFERGPNGECVATQGALVYENFEFDAFEIEMNPDEFAAG